jgi:hypothetical protein
MATSVAAYTNAGSWILWSARFRHRIPSHFSVRVSTIFAVRKEKQARKFYGRPLGGKKHVKNLVWLVGAPNVVVWIMFKPWLVGWNKLKYHIPYHTLQVPYRYPTGILQVSYRYPLRSQAIPNIFRIFWLRQERFLQLFGDDAPSRTTLQTFLHEAVPMVSQNEPDLEVM